MEKQTVKKEGFLIKRGGFVKSWKKRWFKLDGDTLYYLKGSELPNSIPEPVPVDAQDIGKIILAGSVVKKDSTMRRNFCFQLATPNRIYYMNADTQVEADEWMIILVQAGANNGGIQDPLIDNSLLGSNVPASPILTAADSAALSEAIKVKENFTKFMGDIQEVLTKDYIEFCSIETEQPVKENFILKLDVLEAKDLKIMDISGSSDPYCIISMDNLEKKTRTIKCNLNPVFDEHFEFPIKQLETAELQIQLFDEDRIGKHEFMGAVTVKIFLLDKHAKIQNWYKLEPLKNKHKVKGELLLGLMLTTEVAKESSPIEDRGKVLDKIKQISSAMHSKITLLEADLLVERKTKEQVERTIDTIKFEKEREIEFLKKEHEKAIGEVANLQKEIYQQRVKYEEIANASKSKLNLGGIIKIKNPLKRKKKNEEDDNDTASVVSEKPPNIDD